MGEDERTGGGSDAADPLAVVVPKPRSEVAIESLRAEGVYDDDRRVREWDDDHVALPVTDPPAETAVREVVRQVDPEFRTRELSDLLDERGWTGEEIKAAPGSWAVVGSVVLVRVPEGCPDDGVLGEALLELHGEAESVLADEGISGTTREPQTRLLAGERDTETVHTEHGTRYALDPAAVMFSPSNQAERARMGEVVEADERVFDMFAGVGYFTLPMARAGARVTAAEINPTAFRYLLENAMLNDVSDRVEAYRADCRTVAPELGGEADRVVMGYYGDSVDEAGEVGEPGEADAADDGESPARIDEAHEFLPDALAALRPGGVVHYHEATPESRLWERPLGRLDRAAEEAERPVDIVDRRRVKSHSAGVAHVVVDARFE